ncbi:MAG: helix-turn-helix transcriptional regulator [Luteococcus sp.]|nr:helix-turn-helix transcriptional regulator [Luteococcus sp.]MDN5563139.1 helix-turn-helix transcriptional regulator [Luteococcus sp.]
MGDRRDLVWAALAFGGVCAVNAVTGASGLASWERRVFAAPALSALLAFFLVGLCVLAAARLTPTQAGLNASQPARWLEIGCMALGVLGPIGGMAFAVAGDPRHAPGAWSSPRCCAWLASTCWPGPNSALDTQRRAPVARVAGALQGALGERLGVSRQTINSIETGKYDPSLPLAINLARLYGRPVEEIFHADEQ